MPGEPAPPAIVWPLALAGGAAMLCAVGGLSVIRAAMGESPELMEQGWSLTLMMLALPMASIGATLLFVGVALPRLRAIALQDFSEPERADESEEGSRPTEPPSR